MTMSAKVFFAHFKQLNAKMSALGNPSAELQESFNRLTVAFRKAYTPDEFRQAISDDSVVPSVLEEDLTSTQMLLNKERAISG